MTAIPREITAMHRNVMVVVPFLWPPTSSFLYSRALLSSLACRRIVSSMRASLPSIVVLPGQLLHERLRAIHDSIDELPEEILERVTPIVRHKRSTILRETFGLLLL